MRQVRTYWMFIWMYLFESLAQQRPPIGRVSTCKTRLPIPMLPQLLCAITTVTTTTIISFRFLLYFCFGFFPLNVQDLIKAVTMNCTAPLKNPTTRRQTSFFTDGVEVSTAEAKNCYFLTPTNLKNVPRVKTLKSEPRRGRNPYVIITLLVCMSVHGYGWVCMSLYVSISIGIRGVNSCLSTHTPHLPNAYSKTKIEDIATAMRIWSLPLRQSMAPVSLQVRWLSELHGLSAIDKVMYR